MLSHTGSRGGLMAKKKKQPDVIGDVPPVRRGAVRISPIRFWLSVILGLLITVGSTAWSHYQRLASSYTAIKPVAAATKRAPTPTPLVLDHDSHEASSEDSSFFATFQRRLADIRRYEQARQAWAQEQAQRLRRRNFDNGDYVLVEQISSPTRPIMHRFVFVRAGNPQELAKIVDQVNQANAKKDPSEDRTYYLVTPESDPRWASYDEEYAAKAALLKELDAEIEKRKRQLAEAKPVPALTVATLAPEPQKVTAAQVSKPSEAEPRSQALKTAKVSLHPTWMEYRFPVMVGLIYYAVILFGISAGSVFDAIARLKPESRLSVRQVLKHSLTVQHWQGILVSPMIFAAFYVTVSGEGIRTSFLLFALENGFFWRIVLQRVRSSVRGQPTAN